MQTANGDTIEHIHSHLFLPLRLLWDHSSHEKIFTEPEWKTPIDVEEPARRLGDLDSWKAYLESVNSTGRPGPRPGIFDLVRHYQAHASQVPKTLVTPRIIAVPRNFDYQGEIRRPWSIPGPECISIPGWERYDFSLINEELPVNIALVSLLTALAIQFDKLSVEWTIDRNKLHADFGNLVYHACTDGYLKGKEDNKGVAKVLLEVRSASEPKIKNAILVQHGALMVTWIMDDVAAGRAHPSCRFIISQQQKDIFVITGSYDSAYVDYITGNSKNTDFVKSEKAKPEEIKPEKTNPEEIDKRRSIQRRSNQGRVS